MEKKRHIWKLEKDSPSKMSNALRDVERYLCDMEFGLEPTKTTRERAWRGIGVLARHANYCRFGHYDKLESIDRIKEEQA